MTPVRSLSNTGTLFDKIRFVLSSGRATRGCRDHQIPLARRDIAEIADPGRCEAMAAPRK
jgi:hypothetical protein